VKGNLKHHNQKRDQLWGTVIAVQANFYQVRLDSQNTLLCTRPTRLKKIGQKVMVGDRVQVKSSDCERGAIANVLPRKTELKRPPIANAEQIFLVFALEEPTLDPVQLSRFLVKAESTNLKLYLGLNKVDLISQEKQNNWKTRINKWGYEPIFFSVENKQGLDQLNDCFQDKITILAGPSGVGKSSLTSALIPNLELRVNTVSGKLQKGRHTTRHVELYQLPNGGFIADSPGFNQPDLDFEPESLLNYFPEAKLKLNEASCKFSNCLHKDEPECLIRGDWERYQYYLKFLEEAISYQEKLANKPDQESNVKYKVKDSGKSYMEPKLESKKYRRVSRRSKHQNLHTLYEDQSLESLADEDLIDNF
jgi:ribosome biogenesis GTPase